MRLQQQQQQQRPNMHTTHEQDVPAAAAAAASPSAWPIHAAQPHQPHAHVHSYPPQRLSQETTQQPQSVHAAPRHSTDDSDHGGWGVTQLQPHAAGKQAAVPQSHADAGNNSSHPSHSSNFESYEQELLAVWCQVDEHCVKYVNHLADELQAPRLPNQRSHLVTAALEGMAGGSLPAPVACIADILNLPEHLPASIPKIDLPPLMPPARGVRTTSTGSKRVANSTADAAKKGAKKSKDKPKKAATKAKPLSPAVVAAAAAAASAAASDAVLPMVLEEPVSVKLEPEEAEEKAESENDDEEPEPPSEPESSEEEDDYNPNSEEEDEYRPSRKSAASKRKAKGRQGLSAAIFSTGQSKAGRVVKRKTSAPDEDEEADAHEDSDAAEDEDASSSDDDDGERNKKRKGGRGTAMRVFDSKQRRSKLPLKAVTVLRKYFVAHIDNPFPKDVDKARLADECGLAFKQISDWFTNTRKRFWRPYCDYLEREGCVLVNKGKEFGVCKCGAKGAAAAGGNKKKKGADAAADEPAAAASSSSSSADAASAPPAGSRHSWHSMWD